MKNNTNKLISLLKNRVVVLFLLATSFSFSQGVFDKFQDNEDINSMIVSKKLFDLMSNVKVDLKDKEMNQYVTLLKKLENLKVFSTNSTTASTEMKFAVSSYLKSNPLEELMRVNSDEKNVKIYVKSGKNDQVVEELLMFVDGDNNQQQTILLSIIGTFNLDELSTLTEKLKIPGGKNLGKTIKK
ncbi:DUF4252 domain-containing protein [uncultured Flavobacterium sp.]|uniref:DUF4252 domain-containing protein n=1 Tax=uncultured Flavobacterium sp. TaxID=165435 RepID=UPI0030CA3F38|tara:strand:- start:958 stop:1512 length:555 start_codon:yes stop_codon:yes gene_type:complete